MVIRTVHEVNDGKLEWVLDKVAAAVVVAHRRLGRSVAAAPLGSAFKANIDDLRESPSVEIVGHLALRRFADRLLAVEPYVEVLPAALASRACIELVELNLPLAEADVVVVLVDHQQFKAVPREALAGKEQIDTRGLWR